jgi:glycosyltransferase involved in cell wall biosynthesis
VTTRVKVAILIKGLGIGGAERLIAEAVPFWDRERFDYRVAYLLPWKDQLVPQISELDVEVTQIGNGRMGPGTWSAMRDYLSRLQPDLVHAHLPSTGILARLTANAPVVYTEHNVVGSYRFPTGFLNRATYSRNARVIAVSDAVAESLSGYPGPAPLVIPNGVAVSVEPGWAREARASLGVPEDTVLFAHVGNIRPHKGHKNLIEATALLRSQLDDFAVVSIGGEKYPGDLDRLESEVARLGLENRIRFLGRREDAVDIMASADVAVNPSDHEGLPLAVLEAMTLGRPVVATAVGGVPGVIADEETGLLVPAGDPDALAAAMARLATDHELRDRLAAAGQVAARTGYGLERMVREVESVYEEVIG